MKQHKIAIIAILTILSVGIFYLWYLSNNKRLKGDNPYTASESGNANGSYIPPQNVQTPVVVLATYNSLSPNIRWVIDTRGIKIPVIRRGQNGYQIVYLLQYMLNALNNANLILDGNFGPLTEQALLIYTNKKHVDPTDFNLFRSRMHAIKNQLTNWTWFETEGTKFYNKIINLNN